MELALSVLYYVVAISGACALTACALHIFSVIEGR